MRERLIGFGHAVRVFFLLDRIAFATARREHFGGQLLGHRLLVAVARIPDEPTHGEGGPAILTDLDRHLVRGTTDAAAFDFDDGLEVVQGLLEHAYTRLAGLGFHDVHRAVKDAFGGGLLTLNHQVVDELRDGLAVVASVRKDGALYGAFAATHFFLPPLAAAAAAAPFLGRLVPYFERLWLRPLTPDASSVPRTMW